MINDDIAQLLQTCSDHLAIIEQFYKNNTLEKKLQDLTLLIEDQDFWKRQDNVTITRKHLATKEACETYKKLTQKFIDIKDYTELFANDTEELENLLALAKELNQALISFKITLLLNGPEDELNCFLTINSGAGGTESQDWAEMLLRMYIRFGEREGYSIDVLDHQAGEEAGIKSCTLHMKKQYGYGLLRCESGVHRLVRISPFDANKRRHTSFASVTLTPDIAVNDVTIDPEDLQIDTYRAGGAGGQHVNKTDSAVRITHIPSGIVVQCQNERSQLQNKQTAMKMLMVKLKLAQQAELKSKEDAVEKKKIEWGSQIRSYVLAPYRMVKDHRTKFESPQPDDVLDGNLMPFIEAFLSAQSLNTLDDIDADSNT